MTALVRAVQPRAVQIFLAWLMLGFGLMLALLQAAAPGASGTSGLPVLIMGGGLFWLLALYRNALFPRSE